MVDHPGDADVRVSFTVTNTGPREGTEVTQLYVTAPAAPFPVSPAHELKAFATVHLEPGEQRTVTFELSARDFSYWSTLRGSWAIEPGEREIQVGASSRDIRLAGGVHLDPGEPALIAADSTIAEWIAHPVGGPILREAAERSGHPMMLMMIAGEETLKLVGGLPLWKAEGFAPGEFTAAELMARVQHNEVPSVQA